MRALLPPRWVFAPLSLNLLTVGLGSTCGFGGNGLEGKFSGK